MISKDTKLVLPISGGLDSFIAYYYAIKEYGYSEDQIIPVFFDLGQPYKNKELQAISKFSFDVKIIRYDLINDKTNNVPTIHDQVIAGRNLIFTVLSAHLGNRLWICALDGEIHDFMPDKSQRFFDEGSSFISYIYQKDFMLQTPFKDKTKAEIIHWALKNGITEEQLKNTNTCYHHKEWNCGKCSACFKRKIAMSLNNIEEEYVVDPFDMKQNLYAKEYYPKIKTAFLQGDFSHYNEKRCKETMFIMEGYCDI